MNLLFTLALLANLGNPQNGDRMPDTIAICASYDINIDYPDIPDFLMKLVQFMRFAPNELHYSETISRDEKGAEKFRMELKDQSDKEWFIVNTDTSETSFAEPPRSEKDILRNDGIEFISKLRKFFGAAESNWLSASFQLGNDTLTFYVARDTLAEIDDAYAEYKPVMFHFFSSNQNGETYLKCDILAGQKDGLTVYTQINAYLYAKKIELKISLKELKVSKNNRNP
jgi:hypothetical protein